MTFLQFWYRILANINISWTVKFCNEAIFLIQNVCLQKLEVVIHGSSIQVVFMEAHSHSSFIES